MLHYQALPQVLWGQDQLALFLVVKPPACVGAEMHVEEIVDQDLNVASSPTAASEEVVNAQLRQIFGLTQRTRRVLLGQIGVYTLRSPLVRRKIVS